MPITSKRIFQGDPVIWAVFFLLCMISLVEVFSAGSSLSYESGDFMAPLIKQAGFLAAGTFIVWVFHSIPCRFYRLAVLFYPVCVILLIATLFVGSAENDGARWINLGIRFQPSEIAKGVLVATVALILSYGRTERGADPGAMKTILILSGIVCGLIFPENLSTAVLLFSTIIVMLFIGRVPLRQMGRLMAGLFAGGAFVVLLVAITPKSVLDSNSFLHRLDTWVERISDFTGQDEVPLQDTMTPKDSAFYANAVRTGDVAAQDSILKVYQRKAYWKYLNENGQEAYANIAIATGSFVGKMPGNSEQRDYLAQAYSDFIYAIIIEEMGIWGAIIVVFLYVVLLFRAGRIASRCERNFPAFLTMGLALLLVMQAMINILVAVGLAPVTGQPLPLISRGGTSTIINCVYFGIILSVSRYARKNPDGESDEPKALPADPVEREFSSNEGLV